MNFHTLLLPLLVIGALAGDATPYNCRTLKGVQLNVYNTPAQIQVLCLSDYFQGYSLIYQFTDTDEYKLTPPFLQLDEKAIPQPVSDGIEISPFKIYILSLGQTRMDVSILTGSQNHWKDQAATLITRGTASFAVSFGQLNSASNIEFDQQKFQLSHDEPTNCYGVQLMSQDIAVVDCQRVDTPVDIYYIVTRSSMSAVSIKKDALVSGVTRRKSTLLKIGQQKFILSATLTEEVAPGYNNNTQLTITKFNPEDHTLDLKFIVDADALGLQTLSITDIAVDSHNYIYLLDLTQGVFKFAYLQNQTISQPENYIIAGNLYRSVAVIVDSQAKTWVEVLTDSDIIEINWSCYIHLAQFYSIPNDINEAIIDLQVNNQAIMLQTDTQLYFYKRGETALTNPISRINSGNSSWVLLHPNQPRGIVIDDYLSKTFAISRGYLQIKRPTQNTHVTVYASSGPTIKCQVDFIINIVQDLTQIYQVQSFPNTISQPNPASLTLRIEDYLNGQKLEFLPVPYDAVSYQVKDSASVQLEGPPMKLLTSYSINQTAFYRLSADEDINTQITFQLCNSDNQSFSCPISRTLGLSGTLQSYAIIKVISPVRQIYYGLAYSESNTPDQVHLEIFGFDGAIAHSFPNYPYSVTQIAANRDLLFVTYKDVKMITIARLDLSILPHSEWNININSFSPQDQQTLGGIFFPRSVAVSPFDDSIIFVKLPTSVAILKIAQDDTKLIALVEVDVLPLQEWQIVVGQTTFLVLRAALDTMTSAVFEYGIHDIYNPVLLHQISLGNQLIVAPLQHSYSPGSGLLYVKTCDQRRTNYSVMAIRIGKNSLSAVHSLVPVGSDSRFSAADCDLGDGPSSILQIQDISNSLFSVKRTYSSSSLIVKSSMRYDTFKQTIQFGLKVCNDDSSITQQGQLTVFSIIPYLIPTKENAQTLNLPQNSNSAFIVQQFDVESLFFGSITGYVISCDYCDGQSKVNSIQLTNKITELKTDTMLPAAQQIHVFEKEKYIWLLIDSAIQITDLSYKYIRSIPLNIDGCTNWAFDSNLAVFMVYCFPKQLSQSIVRVTVTENRDFGTAVAPLTVPQGYQIDRCHKMILIESTGRIFIVDQDVNATGKGRVRVLNVQANVVGVDTLNSEDFGTQTSQKIINDLITVETTDSKMRLMMVTLDNVGLGFGVFNTNTPEFKLLGASVVEFAKYDSIFAHELDITRYLRIQCLSISKSSTNITYNILITVSYGRHILLGVSFRQDGNKMTVEAVDVLNVFATYELSNIQNTLNTIFVESDRSGFMVASRDYQSRWTSLAIYKIPSSRNQSVINFNKGIELYYQQRENRVPAFALFQSGSEKRLLSNNQYSNSLFNVSDKVYIRSRYEIVGNFSDIYIVPYNFWMISFKQVPIVWGNPQQPGLAWYIYVGIGVGVILLLGVGLALFMKYKKSQLKKSSLLSQRSGVYDQEI